MDNEWVGRWGGRWIPGGWGEGGRVKWGAGEVGGGCLGGCLGTCLRKWERRKKYYFPEHAQRRPRRGMRGWCEDGLYGCTVALVLVVGGWL